MTVFLSSFGILLERLPGISDLLKQRDRLVIVVPPRYLVIWQS